MNHCIPTFSSEAHVTNDVKATCQEEDDDDWVDDWEPVNVEVGHLEVHVPAWRPPHLAPTKLHLIAEDHVGRTWDKVSNSVDTIGQLGDDVPTKHLTGAKYSVFQISCLAGGKPNLTASYDTEKIIKDTNACEQKPNLLTKLKPGLATLMPSGHEIDWVHSGQATPAQLKLLSFPNNKWNVSDISNPRCCHEF